MEEKQKSEKLTYEQLSSRFTELYAQYQKSTEYINRLQSALSENTFNQTSFFISMLFKVMEHTEVYSPEFVTWAKDTIESAMKSFSDALYEQSNGDIEKKD